MLVVDDDASLRQMLCSVLRRRSLVVDEAADGREALALLHEHQYAVVLLDLVMPMVDGFQVLESLAVPGAPGNPVVLVMTGADRSVVARLDASRIHGVVRKPLELEDIASLVKACSDVKAASLGPMVIATAVSGGLLDWLNRFGTS